MKKPSLWVCVLLMIGYTAVTLFGGKWKKHSVIKSDAAGYYAYLSSGVVYHDVFKCKFYGHVDSLYNFGDGVYYYAVQYHPQTQNFYFKYNYGVALFEAPLFLVAHAITSLTGSYPADGYSDYYQLSVALSTVLFGFLGLLVSRKFLLKYFDEWVIAVCLLVIGAGTNFFAQVVTQPGLSHVYLFFVFACLLFVVQQAEETLRLKWFLLLGFTIGLVLVTRPVDIFVLVFPLVWLGVRLKETDNAPYKAIAFALLIISVMVWLQLAYWKIATGHWYFYTYKREHFNFSNWQLLNGLFSFRKGWLVYSPLALLGFLGTFFLWKHRKFRFYLLPFILYFFCVLYITFCWWQWYYGGSFGCRVLVESYAILAFPMSAFIQKVMVGRRSVAFAFGVIVVLLLMLNVFQTAQYSKGIIHWQKMNREYYWRVFGKWSVSDKDKELLLKTEEIPQP